MSKPNLDELSDELLGHQGDINDPAFQPKFPDPSHVRDFADDHRVDLDASQEKAVDYINKATEGDDGLNILGYHLIDPTAPILTPGLAAKAQVAAINAAGDGKLMAAGIDIDGTLTATVHSNVTLDFKSSQIKNTVLDTTYRHYNNVTILAKDVRLTAASIAIDASVEEKNTVTRRKESYRYLYNYGHGTTSELSTPETNTTVTGASFDFSAGNFSYGTFRVGMAWHMFHFGAWRHGVKVFGMTKNSSLEEHGFNMAATVFALIMIFL